MTLYALTHSDMARAAASTADSASSARSAHSGEAYTALANGLPGSTTAGVMSSLGGVMEDGVVGWADDVDRFAEDLQTTAADGVVDDELVSSYLGVIGYAITGEAS